MKIITVGINHKTAPISIREKFYLNQIQQDLLLSELKSSPGVAQAFIISTCNRTELYADVVSDSFESSEVVKLICQIRGISYNTGLMGYFYTLEDDSSINQLLRVITGLDSLVLGEKQILGQVRASFENAQQKGFFLKKFNILANIAIRAGKKAQSETDISAGGSSVSWAAVTKAQKNLGALDDKSVLMIGAGKMSKLAVGQISNRGFKKLYLMNRTMEHAQALAKTCNGEVVSFCDVKEVLQKVDLCICSSSAPHYILEKNTVDKVMQLRAMKRLIFMDISMPRNIDPKIRDIDGVILYDIDHLESVVEKNLLKRQAAVDNVEKIVSDKHQEYVTKLHKLSQVESLNYLEPTDIT